MMEKKFHFFFSLLVKVAHVSDLRGIAISSSSHSAGEVEITSPSKISNGFIYQMLAFSYERLSDHLSFFVA